MLKACSSVYEVVVSAVAVSALVHETPRLPKATHVLNRYDSRTYSLRRHDERSETSCWLPVRSHGLWSRPLTACRPSIDRGMLDGMRQWTQSALEKTECDLGRRPLNYRLDTEYLQSRIMNVECEKFCSFKARRVDAVETG